MVSGTNALAPSPKAACLTARVFDVFNFIVCLCVCNCVCVCVCVCACVHRRSLETPTRRAQFAMSCSRESWHASLGLSHWTGVRKDGSVFA